MYHATMAAISTEQNRDLRDQASTWELAREARGAGRARAASPFALIGRGARSQARQKRQQGAAAA